MSRTSFTYCGPAFQGTPGAATTVAKQKFEVIEFCSYEPSNYVHSPYWLVIGADGAEYAIDADDLDDHEAATQGKVRCSTCNTMEDALDVDDGECIDCRKSD
jgi:hypothetical protein